METELISVIVPVYNVERYLRRCVDSILHQTYQDLEVLLVDDGSTDASGAICDEYAAQEERVTAVHQKNGGLSAARNTGLERAQGTYLCFVDSDDFLDSRMLDTLCRDLQDQDADLAVVGFRMFEREEELAPAELAVPVQCITGREAIRSTLVSYELGDFAWNKLYKRAMFDTLRFRDGKRYEDQFFMLDVLRRCGADVRETQDAVTVRRGALRGVTIDAAPIPDLIPVLSVVAALADGQTQIVNAARLRLKESDRLKSTANLLRALGGQVEEKEDGLAITGVPALHGGAVETQNDHRLAMSAATAACAATGEITVDNDGCVAKSYPRFWEDFSSLKGEGL